MGGPKTLQVTNRSDWRTWLEQNHDKATEIWLVYYKRHTGLLSISYEDAVEEALCFGWIDSIVRRIDDERYAQKFTPRSDKSQWSALNKRRVAKLIREGRMTPAGLAKLTYPLPEAHEQANPEEKRVEPVLSPGLRSELMANEKAWAFFQQLAPSHRHNYIRWVMSAKQDETRRRRLQEMLDLLAQGQKLGLK